MSQLARAHLKAVEPAPTGVSLAHDSPRAPPSWYAATRAIVVEARAALGQAEELGRVLEELGEGP